MNDQPHHRRARAVLQLDVQGTPQAWISLQDAALHLASGSVAWVDGGEPLATFRGGHNAALGRQSTIEIAPIIALHGASKVNLFDVAPALTKAKVLLRDRLTCIYCVRRFAPHQLSCDHIVPRSRGGTLSWRNTAGCCVACNQFKRDRTPQEAGMKLAFVPYVPSLFEDMILQGRNIRADVHEWLAARLPRHSRLH